MAEPTPLPKRPKGRFLVGTILMLLVSVFIYTIWQAFFAVLAHGVVEGRKLRITPMQTGFIRTIHIRDGSFVEQGDPLFTLEKVDSTVHQEDRIENQLNAAIHEFRVEIAKHRVNASLSNNQKAKARAEYLHWLGELLQEQAKLDELADRQRRSRILTQKKSLGAAELRTIEYEMRGQRSKVEKLSLAVEQLEKNAASIETDVDFTDLVQAHQEKISDLQERLAEQRLAPRHLTIRAPVAGKILRICHFTGERVEPGEALMEMVEGGSLRPVLYLSQELAARYEPGHPVQVELKPNRGLLQCTVERVGDEFVSIPESLKGKINRPNQVVSIHLRPDNPDIAKEMLRLGSLIEMPHCFPVPTWFENPDQQDSDRPDRLLTTSGAGP